MNSDAISFNGLDFIQSDQVRFVNKAKPLRPEYLLGGSNTNRDARNVLFSS